MGEAMAHGFNGIMLEVGPLISLSIKRWQGGECVDVECVPAKPALKAGETVEVTATANSKQDLSKINGDQKAFGTQSVTPDEQRGEPSAVYNAYRSEGRRESLYQRYIHLKARHRLRAHGNTLFRSRKGNPRSKRPRRPSTSIRSGPARSTRCIPRKKRAKSRRAGG